MRRLVLLALAACGLSGPARDDPAIGKWGPDENAGFELRADGRLDKPITADLRCEREDEPAVAACRGRQTWKRVGSTTIELRMGVLAGHGGGGSFTGMFDSHGGACVCTLEPIRVELVDDELVVGDERAQRRP